MRIDSEHSDNGEWGESLWFNTLSLIMDRASRACVMPLFDQLRLCAAVNRSTSGTARTTTTSPILEDKSFNSEPCPVSHMADC
jgi:hypothetical protein